MTGLTQGEFCQLLPHFHHAWDQYVQHNYVQRNNRQRQYGGGRSEETLVNIGDKLLFILYYISLPDTFSTLRHMINSLNQMAFIFFPAEHDVKVGSLYTPP